MPSGFMFSGLPDSFTMTTITERSPSDHHPLIITLWSSPSDHHPLIIALWSLPSDHCPLCLHTLAGGDWPLQAAPWLLSVPCLLLSIANRTSFLATNHSLKSLPTAWSLYQRFGVAVTQFGLFSLHIVICSCSIVLCLVQVNLLVNRDLKNYCKKVRLCVVPHDIAWCEQSNGAEERPRCGDRGGMDLSNDCLLGYLCALWNHAGWFQQSRVSILCCCSPSSGTLVLSFCYHYYAEPLPSLSRVNMLRHCLCCCTWLFCCSCGCCTGWAVCVLAQGRSVSIREGACCVRSCWISEKELSNVWSESFEPI